MKFETVNVMSFIVCELKIICTVTVSAPQMNDGSAADSDSIHELLETGRE